MDFNEALYASGTVIFTVLIISLSIYVSRIREIYNQVGEGTRKALWGYGSSGIGMAIATLVGLVPELRFLITGVGAFFLGSIVFAQVWVLFPPKRAKISTAVIIALIAAVFVDNFLRREFPTFPMYLMMIGLTILLLGSLFFSILLIRESPSTFTVSIFVMLLLYMITWVVGSTYWIFENPEFFVLQTIPLVVAAAIFGSIRRPLRHTLSTFIILLMITIDLPLLDVSFRSGEWMIWAYVAVEAFALLCLIAPLNYFLEQAALTENRTPRYLSLVVSFVGALVIFHSLGWAMYVTAGFVWNQYMIWFDVILGAIAVAGFMLAAISSAYGDWAYTVSREMSVAFGTSITLLSFPPMQSGMMLFLGIVDPELYNSYLWYTIAGIVIFGFLIYIRVAVKLTRSGAGGAAQRLVLFLLSAILMAFATMFSDDIPIAVALTLLSVAGVLALLSSPPITARVRRGFRRTMAKDDKEIQQESTIRW